MLKKFKKQSAIKEFKIDTELEGHLFSYGRIGAGKSVSTKSIVEGYKDNHSMKFWDLYGGTRNEGLYNAIPSRDILYWAKISKISKFNEPAPKQYKVNFLYPCFYTKIPKKLPIKKIKGNIIVNSKLFTIPMSDIVEDDIRMVIGNLSDSNKYIWEEILNKKRKKDTSIAMEFISNKIKGQSTTLYKNFILPMIRERFLSDDYAETNVDIIEEAKDREAITVLCLDFIPEKYHLFILNYFIRKIKEYVENGKIKKKNLLFIREAATFFRATEDSVLEDRFKIFRVNLANYIRYGRSGLHMALDCQSASETRGLVSGSEDFMLMFETTSWRDKEEMCNEMKREGRISQAQINDLAFLKRGQCYIAERGKVAHKVQVLLPRSAYWKKDLPNFYTSLWESSGGEWKNSEEIKDEIINKEKETEEYYKILYSKDKKQELDKKNQPIGEKDINDLQAINTKNNISDLDKEIIISGLNKDEESLELEEINTDISEIADIENNETVEDSISSFNAVIVQNEENPIDGINHNAKTNESIQQNIEIKNTINKKKKVFIPL